MSHSYTYVSTPCEACKQTGKVTILSLHAVYYPMHQLNKYDNICADCLLSKKFNAEDLCVYVEEKEYEFNCILVVSLRWLQALVKRGEPMGVIEVMYNDLMHTCFQSIFTEALIAPLNDCIVPSIGEYSAVPFDGVLGTILPRWVAFGKQHKLKLTNQIYHLPVFN